MTSANDRAEGISLVQLISTLLRRRRSIVALPLAAMVLLVAIALVQKRTYTVSATFVPQSVNVGASQLSGLAAQFGVSVGGQETGGSLDFYAALVKSAPLLRALVQTEYLVVTENDTLRGNLVDFYEVDEDSPRLADERTVKKLRGDYRVSIDPKAGLVAVSIRSHYPDLSLAIARQAIQLVNQFNQETQQSQARAERAFIQERLAELAQELRASEDSLAEFLKQNREFRGSPELTFAFDRLQRRVTMRQQVYTSLTQGYEQARIDEVRNTPVITVFEEPIIPARPDSRRILFRGLLALALGSVVGVLLAIGFEVFDRSRANEPEEAERLRQLSGEAISDITRPWRILKMKKG